MNVEVADEVFRIEPPVRVSPALDASPTAEIPPENVEVAVPVTLNDPTERVPVAVRLPVVIEFATVSEPMILELPSTDSLILGDVVPMPRKPPEVNLKLAPV